MSNVISIPKPQEPWDNDGRTFIARAWYRFLVLLAQAVGQIAVKAAATSRTSTTTLAADPDLYIPVQPGEIWCGRIHLAVSAAIKTTGIAVSVTAPSGASGEFTSSIITDAASGQEVTVLENTAINATATFAGSALSNSNNGHIEIVFYVKNGSTKGTIGVSWAQATSSATALTLNVASQLKADKIK